MSKGTIKIMSILVALKTSQFNQIAALLKVVTLVNHPLRGKTYLRA